MFTIHRCYSICNKSFYRDLIYCISYTVYSVLLALAIRASLVTSQHSFFKKTMDVVINSQELLYNIYILCMLLVVACYLQTHYTLFLKKKPTNLHIGLTLNYNKINLINFFIGLIASWLLYTCIDLVTTNNNQSSINYLLWVSITFTIIFFFKKLKINNKTHYYNSAGNKINYNTYTYLHLLCILFYTLSIVIFSFFDFLKHSYCVRAFSNIFSFLNIDFIFKTNFSNFQKLNNQLLSKADYNEKSIFSTFSNKLTINKNLQQNLRLKYKTINNTLEINRLFYVTQNNSQQNFFGIDHTDIFFYNNIYDDFGSLIVETTVDSKLNNLKTVNPGAAIIRLNLPLLRTAGILPVNQINQTFIDLNGFYIDSLVSFITVNLNKTQNFQLYSCLYLSYITLLILIFKLKI